MNAVVRLTFLASQTRVLSFWKSESWVYCDSLLAKILDLSGYLRSDEWLEQFQFSSHVFVDAAQEPHTAL